MPEATSALILRSTSSHVARRTMYELKICGQAAAQGQECAVRLAHCIPNIAGDPALHSMLPGRSWVPLVRAEGQHSSMHGQHAVLEDPSLECIVGIATRMSYVLCRRQTNKRLPGHA